MVLNYHFQMCQFNIQSFNLCVKMIFIVLLKKKSFVEEIFHLGHFKVAPIKKENKNKKINKLNKK